MKKLLTLALAAIMVIGLSGCQSVTESDEYNLLLEENETLQLSVSEAETSVASLKRSLDLLQGEKSKLQKEYDDYVIESGTIAADYIRLAGLCELYDSLENEIFLVMEKSNSSTNKIQSYADLLDVLIDNAKKKQKYNENNPIGKKIDSLSSEISNSATDSYESIYNEYVEKIKSSAKRDMESLAIIANEGVGKMAEHMLETNSLYKEYEEWAAKLYDAYTDEATESFR